MSIIIIIIISVNYNWSLNDYNEANDVLSSLEKKARYEQHTKHEAVGLTQAQHTTNQISIRHT